MHFSPVSQNTISDVQIRIREIDMALHPSVKSSLGNVRTFTYSTLAACCNFLDSVKLGEFSSEVETFAKEVVAPIVDECLLEIEKFSNKMGDDTLKLNLANKLRTVQQYNFPGFKKDLAPELISELKKVVTAGNIGLYRLNEADSKYYGGVAHVDEESFKKAAAIMEKAGYKQEGDISGSSFDVGAHVTTLLSRELSENYDFIIDAHDEFFNKGSEVTLQPICIDYGFPQSGILSKSVVITLESPEIASYRKACGLGPISPPLHLSIFSRVVQPLQELEDKKITFNHFINSNSTYLEKFDKIFKEGMRLNGTVM